MKKFGFLKSLSRSVHEDEEDHIHVQQISDCEKEYGSSGACSSLTVWRKSLLINCNGFTVIDSKGNLIYRVDNHIGHPAEITLMDASGKSLFTLLRRKKLGMVDTWFVYEGEDCGQNCSTTATTTSKRPIFCIRKHIKILRANPNHILAYIYRNKSDKVCAYMIEGSYIHRSCKIVDDTNKEVVAETRRKEPTVGGVSYGIEVFQLIVQPCFDPGYAMALVLLLDQMFS